MEFIKKKFAFIALALLAVVLVGCGGGGSSPDNDTESPATNLDENDLNDSSDAPVTDLSDEEIEWHQSETLSNGVRYSYATFGKPGTLIVNQERGITQTILETVDDTTGEARPQYAITFIENGNQSSLVDWFETNVDLSGSIIASGNYIAGATNNGIEYLNITGPIPPEHVGPIPDLYAFSPSGDLVIVIQTIQQSPVLAASSQSFRDVVYLTILESMTFQ